MRSNYGFVLYRCRLCGETDRSSHVPDGLQYLTRATGALWEGGYLGNRYIDGSYIYSVHTCKDGRVGVADLIGFDPDIKEEQEGDEH